MFFVHVRVRDRGCEVSIRSPFDKLRDSARYSTSGAVGDGISRADQPSYGFEQVYWFAVWP
jgi:hypothetical protein